MAPDRFRHEALFYAGNDEFVRETTSFIRDAVEREEPILVVVSDAKIAMLRDELGPQTAREVDFADMATVGHNPARIIPAWYDFVADRATDGRHIRGIGEPINNERTPEALIECQRHESLLNLAFASASAWWLLCPYDTDGLDPDVIDEALRSHPYAMQDGEHRRSETYRDLVTIAKPFDLPLPEPEGPVVHSVFDISVLDDVRQVVHRYATSKGLACGRVTDLVLAVNEVVTNSIRYGGGAGLLRMWTQPGEVVCEVSDGGLIDRPLVGRKRPSPGQEGGFGVWLVHQVCDLVQLRTFADGNVVRMHMSL
jgi:anti-sigma regulatory factor (Ser/Thr protein kinase)